MRIRYIYIKETGRPAWNPGFLPIRTGLDRYQCRHGMGYTVFDSEKDGLRAELTCFVPLGENCRVGWYPIACHRIDVTLEPGQSWRCTFVLGYGQNPRDQKFITPGVIRKDTAHRVMEKFASFAAVDAAKQDLAAYWKVGSRECKEGQIYIEPQGFCTLAGVGKETGEMKKALDSVRARLLGKYGVELLAPCYTEYHLELGELTVRRQFRGAEYTIHIRQTGTRSMVVNGQAVESDRVPLFPVGSRVQIEATL